MKKIIIRVASLVAFLLTAVAFAGAASASTWIAYEPKLPDKLRR